MPYEVVIPKIETALRAVLVADATLVSLLATKATAQGGGPAIYNDGAVPPGALMPFLTIGAWTQIPFNSFHGFGYNCTGQLKAVGQIAGSRTETTVLNVMSAVFAALEQGNALDVDGYDKAWLDEFQLQPSLKTALNNVVTVEVPAILRVYVT